MGFKRISAHECSHSNSKVGGIPANGRFCPLEESSPVEVGCPHAQRTVPITCHVCFTSKERIISKRMAGRLMETVVALVVVGSGDHSGCCNSRIVVVVQVVAAVVVVLAVKL